MIEHEKDHHDLYNDEQHCFHEWNRDEHPPWKPGLEKLLNNREDNKQQEDI